jgi:phosphohistidine swiveling domain-containing protein
VEGGYVTGRLLGLWSDPEVVHREGGGKAAHLFELERRGYPVPAWFCLPASVCDRLRSSDDAGEVRHDVRDGLARLGLLDAFVAVRSSGIEEDSAEYSFAGQFESYLYQKGEAQILDAIRRCLASAESALVEAYRRTAGLNGSRVRMGVIVQRMVDSDCAGVAFSRNPLRPSDRSTVVIDSVWGQGEGLVSGALDADHFEVDRETLAVHTRATAKIHAVTRGEGGGTRLIPLDEARRRGPSLTEQQARDVARLVVRLERDLGRPQDCEWAFAGGRLYCLQTRPITNLPPDAALDPRINGAEPVIWDNSNVVESFAGVTTPLTFSHVSRGCREIYRQYCRLMGLPERVIAEHESVFANMVGLVRGRVYYNLLNWYRLLALFPGVSQSKGFMETMMGVKQSLSPELAELFAALGRAPRYALWRRAMLFVGTVYRLARTQRYVAEFMARVERVIGPLEVTDLRASNLPEQLAVYRRLERELLARWTAPVVSDVRCMIAFGLLRALTTRWVEPRLGTSGRESLQNDLLCGEADLKSAEPARALMRIAEHVERGDPAIRQQFLAESPDHFWASLQSGFAPDLRAMFTDFLRRYGFRCADELKLEAPDLHDDPRFAVASVQSYVRLGRSTAQGMGTREREIRRRAEARVRAALSAPKRWLYFYVLRWARRAVSTRELLRFERTRAFGVTRRLFRAIGANLTRLGVLDDERDVFYLTVDELLAFQDGRSLSTDLRPLAALRRRQFDEFRRTPAPPDRFVTRGSATAAMRYPILLLDADLLAAAAVTACADPDVLRGTPCAPGVVEGAVRIASRIEDAEGLNGEILVAERTDPGWVPLFPACSGLIIERGSPLSHSAVVARELGIPTIVGVGGRPAQRLKSGQRVRMDAGKGEVRIL